MASAPAKTLIFLVSLSLFSFISSAASSSSDSGKVQLGLYYESLCPYSANFIVKYLAKLYEGDDDLFSIIDLHLSPWGNARLISNDSFICQHGPSECLLNTIEACAIHAWPKLGEHFPFIDCVETLVHEHRYNQWETCFEKFRLDSKPIADCYGGGLGKELELQYAAETNELQPPHQYVPWVVVDGQPLYEDYENFVSYICKAYKNKSKSSIGVPKACSGISDYTVLTRKARPSIPVSYKEKKMSPLSERIISALSLWMQHLDEFTSL